MKPLTHNPLARARTVWSNRNEPEYARAFADLYWRALICAALVILILAAIYAALFFTSVLAQFGSATPHSASSAAPALDENELQATVDGLAGRASAFQSLESEGAPRVADPSTGD